MCNLRRFYRLRELHEADFHKPGNYGIEQVWATAWDVFYRIPYRGVRARRDAVDFVVCFGCVGVSIWFRLFSSNAHGVLQVRDHLTLSTSLLL